MKNARYFLSLAPFCIPQYVSGHKSFDYFIRLTISKYQFSFHPFMRLSGRTLLIKNLDMPRLTLGPLSKQILRAISAEETNLRLSYFQSAVS